MLVRTADPHLLGGEHRILAGHEKAYYQRLEDAKAIDEVKKWSKVKSREATQLARRIEAAQQGNRFKACEFEPAHLKKLNTTPREPERNLRKDSNEDLQSPASREKDQSRAPQAATARPSTYIE